VIEIEVSQTPTAAFLLGGWEYESAALPTVSDEGVWSLQISSQPVAVALDVHAPGCAAGCPAGTLCLEGVCACASAGSNEPSACETLDFCLTDGDCASARCRRFRGSLTWKVCAAAEENVVVDAAVQLTGVSADTFGADTRAAFVEAVAGLFPGLDSFARVVIVEVTSVEQLGRRAMQNAEGQVDGGAEAGDAELALVRFQIVGSESTEAAATTTDALNEGTDALSDALSAAGIGTDAIAEYAVRASVDSVSIVVAHADCLGVIDGPAVHDPVRATSGRLSALRVFLSKSILYGAFVWARRALNSQKRRFPARAVRHLLRRWLFVPGLRRHPEWWRSGGRV
jgi:hypothetical protein